MSRKAQFTKSQISIHAVRQFIEKEINFTDSKIYLFFMAEMKRFELLRRFPDLPHFECGPFSLLGTSPFINHFKILPHFIIKVKKNSGDYSP